MGYSRPTRKKIAVPQHCALCGKLSTNGTYCCREHALEAQRRTFGGYTIRELAEEARQQRKEKAG